MEQIVFLIRKNVVLLSADKLMEYSNMPAPQKPRFFCSSDWEYVFSKESHWKKLVSLRENLKKILSGTEIKDSPEQALHRYAEENKNGFEIFAADFSFLLEKVAEFLEISGECREAQSVRFLKYTVFLLSLVVYMRQYLTEDDWQTVLKIIRLLRGRNILFF